MIAAWGWIGTTAWLALAPGADVPAPEREALWGANGHRIVAEIAERHLTDVARARAYDLLGGVPLARVASWADDYRGTPEGGITATWHYTTLTAGSPWATTPADQSNDVGEAILAQRAVLADETRPRAERTDALRFLVHFIGDLHQPMHVGRPGDRGGNDIRVRFFGQDTNLHSVWDTRIIEHHGLSYTEWVHFLDRATAAQISDWQDDPMEVWIAESQELREVAYEALGDAEIPFLSWDYRNAMTPHIEDRLLRGGIRLAGVLNAVLDGD